MTKPEIPPRAKADNRSNDDDRPPRQTDSSVAQQIAWAAAAFEQERTGVRPKSVTVVISDNTLVITLHGALSPAEQALAKTAAGAAEVGHFHRQLFASASNALRREINRITGVPVRESAVEVEPSTGAVVGVFTTGTTVQVYLLAESVPTESWSGPNTAAETSD
jgi:uncharacterized protein YbcI